jgi:hypothetical protein
MSQVRIEATIWVVKWECSTRVYSGLTYKYMLGVFTYYICINSEKSFKVLPPIVGVYFINFFGLIFDKNDIQFTFQEFTQILA